MARSINPFRWPLNREVRTSQDQNRFILQTVQPALAGLMDGSVSTLAPIFAAAFATRNPHIAFLVGLSASIGAAISMAFAEGLSDDGRLTGRGHPFRRGVIIGLMTFLGGIFHTVPFLMSDLDVALIIAYLVVGFTSDCGRRFSLSSWHIDRRRLNSIISVCILRVHKFNICRNCGHGLNRISGLYLKFGIHIFNPSTNILIFRNRIIHSFLHSGFGAGQAYVIFVDILGGN